MENLSDYEAKVERLVREWDERIENLRDESSHAIDTHKKRIDEEISQLIMKREAVRRGLLRVGGSEDELCLTCKEPDETLGSVFTKEGNEKA
ncbi:hypothetical protein [Desulfomonile tiedjei]|uniref:Uncharacterized protein n=1 Tax=Desulfomonile tiedjei (strain ATCC 49306 / DSM 6799 / DCB-1) TaxID=706587 RepID=I4C700_DESTA|nr:hypothetical protein [Desulfomonile tiedjei]AFM25341.1 hypothetical protein Desti_2662 [Desulfomonile tiedjei DSM 6799]